jgi:hypothetical protein
MYIDPLAGGSRVASAQETPPEPRGVFGWARDTGIDVARSGLGLARDVQGARAAISTALPKQFADTDRQQENLTTLENLDYALKRAKTETGQYREEHPPSWGEAPVGKATELAAGMAGYALPAAAGPAAPALFGGLAYGHAQSDLHERLRDMPEADLMKSPDYKQYRDQGMSDQAARNQLFVDSADPTKMKNLLAVLPTVAGNVIGGGVAGQIGGIVLSKATQLTVSDAITNRVLKNVNESGMVPWMQRRLVGGAEAGIGGAAMGGGSDVTQQMQEQNLGLRKDVDWGQAAGAAGQTGMEFGPVGALMHRVNMAKRRGQPPAAEPPPGGRPPPQKPPGHADDLGEDITATAAGQQQQPGAGNAPGVTPPPPGGPPGGAPPPPRPGPIRRGGFEEEVGPGGEPPPYAPDDITRTPRVPPAHEPLPDTGGIGPGYGVDRPGEPGGPPVTIPGGRFEDMPGTPVLPRPEPERRPTPQFPEIERPGLPRGEEFGGEPSESEIPYPDRARLRQGLRTLDPQERAALADVIEHAVARGVRPTIPIRGTEWLDRFIDTSPRSLVGELRRGLEQVPGTARLSPEHATALQRVTDRVDPQTAQTWATEIQRTLDAGARTVMWNRLPKSMRDALGADRAAVVEALRTNPREVIDALAGRAHTPEAPRYRDVGTRDVVEPTTPVEPVRQEAPYERRISEEGQPQVREVPPEVYRDLAQEAEGQARDQALSEYGPAHEPGEAPYLTRRHRRQRVGTEADIGLTRAGRFAPGTEPRMAGTLGQTLRHAGPRTETRVQALLRRAQERREAREREAAVRTGNIRPHPESVHEARPEPEPGVEHITPEVQRHKARVAEEEARRAELHRDIAEQQQAERGRRMIGQTIDTIAHFRQTVSQEFQRALDRIPLVRDMARMDAEAQQRRDRDSRRKARSREGDQRVREQVVSRVLQDKELNFSDILTPLIEHEAISPTGQRYASTARERADLAREREAERQGALPPSDRIETEQERRERVGGGEVLPLDNVSKDALFAAGKRMVEMMRVRVMIAANALNAAGAARTRPGQKPRIGWNVPTVRSGALNSTWYDRLADLNRYSSALRREIEKGNTEVVRGMMTNIWMRERMMERGDIGDWERYHRDVQQGLWNDLVVRRDTLDRQLQQRMAPGSGGFSARRESQIRSEINSLNAMIDGMREIGGKDADIVDMDAKIHEQQDSIARMFSERQRRIMLDWVRDRLSGMTEEERIQRDREMERNRRETAERNQATEPRTPTHTEMRTRVQDIDARIDQLAAARERVPDDTTGRVREIIDTLRAETARPGEQPEPLTQPQKTAARLKQMLDAIEAETNQLHQESRRLHDALVPGARDKEYNLRGVLDPAADLKNKRNLPEGATARPLSDYLQRGIGSERSIRPARDTGTGRGFRPGDPAHAIIDHYLDVVNEVSGDAHVVTLTDEQMQLAARQRDLPPDTPAFYDTATHRILINRASMFGPDRAAILRHEFGHPMVEAAIERFPEIGRRLDAVRKLLADAYFAERPESVGKIVGGEYVPSATPIRDILGANTHGLTNVHEFVTTLFSDPRYAAALNEIKTTPEQRAALAPPAARQTLLDRVLRAIKRGLTNLFFSVSKKRLLNEATLNSLDLFQSIRAGGRQRARERDIARPITAQEAANWTVERARDTRDRFGEFKNYLGTGDLSLKLHNLSDVEHRGSEGMRERTKTISQVMDRQNAAAIRHKENPEVEAVAHRMADLMRLNTRAYEELQNYLADTNHYQVHGGDPLGQGRNAHISAEGNRHIQQREIYPEIKARWDAMTDVQKRLWEDQQRLNEQKHDAVLHAELGQLIDTKKLIPDGAPGGIRSRLLRYIIDGEESLSDREKRALTRYVPGYDPADTANHEYFTAEIKRMRANPQFRKLPIWAPSMRRGDWVTEGRYNMDELKGRGTQLGREDNRPSGEFEHETAAERDAFIRRVMQDERFKGVRLLDTNDIVYAKDEQGGILRDANGKPVPLTEAVEHDFGDDVGETTRRVRAKKAGEEGIVRYRTRFNPLLLEFHERLRDAQQRHRELQDEARAGHLDLSDVSPKRDHYNTYLDPAKADRIFREMQASVINSRGYRDMDETSRALVLRDLKEGGIRTMMSMSARSKMLPRQFAQGARKAMIRDFVEYHRNTAQTLAGLEHRTELAAALKNMDDYVRGTKNWASPNDPQGQFGITDAKVARSMHERAMRHPNEVVEPFWSKGLTTVLRLSYLDKLMSPMFWALQSIEPWTISAPALAGSRYARRGGTSAYQHLFRAMNDIQGARVMGQGFKDAWNTGKAGPFGQLRQSDLGGRLRDNVAHDAEAVDLLQHLQDHSVLDRNAGLELAQTINPTGGLASHMLDWTDHMSRQINTQIEGVNRAGVGLAAYRMAREAGADIAEAKEFARTTVHETAGNYNAYASAPIFNNPYLRPALQFKRYAGRMTSQWMRTFWNFGLAAAGKLPEAERNAAFRKMAYMAGTTIATSGFLGLPTEPLKGIVNATQGITGYNADRVERELYEATVGALGPDLGEFLAKGGFRYAGLGIGQRVGYDSLWTFGSIGTRPSDIYQSVGHFVAGAPGSYVADVLQGTGNMANTVGHLINGRDTEARESFLNATEQMLPIKTLADTIGAIRKQVGGPMYRMPSSGLPQGIQPSAIDTLVQALGAQTSTVQRAGEKRAAMKADQRHYSEDKKKIETQYAYASNPAERAAIMQSLRSFNQQWPELKPLTVGDLVKARHRYEAKETADPSLLGVTMTRQQKTLLPRYSMYDQ